MLENTGLVLEGGGMRGVYTGDIRILYGTRFIFSICNRCISWCLSCSVVSFQTKK